MKCRDCEKLVWGYDEGERIWWCAKRGHCPDLDVERNCSEFSLKKPDIFTALSTLQAENKRLQEMYQKEKAVCHATQAELEQVKRERDAAVKTIFKWTGCPECKYWNSADEWCEKHDREADSCGECDSPEWRGPEEE